MSDERDEKPIEQERGPLGDARPEAQDIDPRANPSEKPEPVEERVSVGIVKPEDYPAADRADSDPTGAR